MSNFLPVFRLWLAQSNRKKSTVALTLRNIQYLQSFCPSFNKFELVEFFIKQKEQGKSSRYLNNLIDSLRVLKQFDPSLVPYVPKYFKELPSLKSTMSDEEIEKFLALPPPTVMTRYRDGRMIQKTFSKGYKTWTLFFAIMAYTGMRPNEVATLTIDSCDFGREVFVLADTKTNTPRYVPIPQHLSKELEYHVKKCSLYLFPSLRGGKKFGISVVDNVDWHYAFNSRLKRMGIKRNGLTPYSLRHSFITRMLEEDVNIFKVQKIVGHRQLSTTAIYTHMTTKDIINSLKKDRLARKSSSPTEKLQHYLSIVKQFALVEDTDLQYLLEETPRSFKLEVSVKTN